MRQASVQSSTAAAREAKDSRLPILACLIIILGASAGCYWLLFRLIGTLGLW